MSIVGSIFSTRSSVYSINARAGSIMDSIFAIGFGLGLRFVVDAISSHDLKLTGTLVGLWEGVIMLHFLQKMPHSFDPYVGYGVRLFVDFLVTESIARLVLVLLWTGMGMVLADITPALWEDTGMRRFWHRFRRDLFLMSRSMPRFTFLSKPRTVRFSPSRSTSVATSNPSSVASTPTPSVVSPATTLPQPSTRAPSRVPQTPRRKSRLFPGSFESETETDRGSVVNLTNDGPGTSRGYTFSTIPPTNSAVSSQIGRDFDEDDIYGSSSSSTSTELPDPASIDIPEIIVPETPGILAGGFGAQQEQTPKQGDIPLPPTPSDTAPDIESNNAPEQPEEVQPTTAAMPNIPDLPETAGLPGEEDWEKVEMETEADASVLPSPIPPPPPPKDIDLSSAVSTPKASSSKKGKGKGKKGLSLLSFNDEPVNAEPVKAESTKAQSTKARSTKAESTKAQSTKAESVKGEPAYTEAESVKGEPASIEAETVKGEPASTEAEAATVEAAWGARSEASLKRSSSKGKEKMKKAQSTTSEPPPKAESVVSQAKAPALSALQLEMSSPEVGPLVDKDDPLLTSAEDDPLQTPIKEKADEAKADAEKEKAAERSPPPSFSQIYPDTFNVLYPETVQATEEAPVTADPTTAAPAGETVEIVDNPAAITAENADAVIASDSDDSKDVLIGDVGSRLTQAVEMRERANALEKRLRELRRQEASAKDDGPAGVGLAFIKKKEADEVEKDIARLKRKADKRFFSANNDPSEELSGKLDLSDLTPDRAVDLLEERLVLLLASSGHSIKVLEVTLAKNPKGRTMKTKILKAMKDHGMNTTDDKSNGRILRVTLPSPPAPDNDD